VDPVRMEAPDDQLYRLNNQRKLAACVEELFASVERNVYRFPK